MIPLLKSRGVDWKQALVAWKFKLSGEDQIAEKYQYQDARAEAWGKTMYGGISEWCRAHGVVSIGHFLEHDWEYLSEKLSAGNMFQLQKYSSMGGIDLVFKQLPPGKRPMGKYQMAKLASSISHVYGKQDDRAMVEIFGARGQDLTYPEMKWNTDQMQVSGVNFLIPHSFNPRAPYDADCPPYFYNGGFEPRYPLYRVFADYTSRLSVMLTGGRHEALVALLFIGNSAHVGKAIPPEVMTTALQDALFDCDWMPYDVFERDTRLGGKRISLFGESYKILIVPPVEVIPYGALEKAKAFFEAGGMVVGYGFLPDKSATPGKSSKDIAALVEGIWGAEAKPGLSAKKTRAGGHIYFQKNRLSGKSSAHSCRMPGFTRSLRWRRVKPIIGCMYSIALRAGGMFFLLPTRTWPEEQGHSSSESGPRASQKPGTLCATKLPPLNTGGSPRTLWKLIWRLSHMKACCWFSRPRSGRWPCESSPGPGSSWKFRCRLIRM